jgi:hypothetical protein
MDERQGLPVGDEWIDDWLSSISAGQHHRILQRPDGQLGYALDHKYSVPRLFPGPWYPEGGVLPKKF